MTTSIDYLKELNKVQAQAVQTTEGPVLVVAGPGSGKTRVLTYRVAYLMENKAKPWEILMLTFTNKAAKEMKERIEQVAGKGANRIWAGTFHSIFARILRIEASKIGYPSNFTIYDTDDSKSVIKAILKELNLDTKVYNVNAVLSRISSAKTNLLTPKLYEQNEELRLQDRMAKRPHVHEIYKRYTARCKRAGAMDFDDLLYRFFELLQKNTDGVLDKYRERFKYIMVDEFQDTNHLQYRIVQKLVHYPNSSHNICVVGDDAQSIYAFRGATIQNILDFEKDFAPFGIQVFKLEQNYRSTSHIVQAANELITHNRNQIPKTIWSHKGVGQRIKVIKALTDTEEGKRVADAITEQKNRHHLSNKDIAILYRTNAQSRVFEEYLRRYNIPYRVFGGLSFYQRKEVKDLIAYLRLAVNPKDEEALRRVINYPRRGIGASSIDKVSRLAGEREQTMWEVLGDAPLSARAKNAITNFAQMIKSFQKKAAETNAYESARFVLSKSGLHDSLKADTTIEGMNRLENLNSLMDGIKEFVEADLEEDVTVEDKSLASYIQNIALLTDADSESNDNNHVTLMSVHAAKGLEFPSVFVVGLEEDLFPSFMSKNSREGIDEERRLFYVAITRAESFLTLTYAASRYHHGKTRYNDVSQFLEEIDTSHLDADVPARARASFGSKSSNGNARSGVQGNFKKRTRREQPPVVDPSTFQPNLPNEIEAGQEILHLKFGKGKVQKIDGNGPKRVATILFPHLDAPEKRIMLKFAKLQILSPKS
ncbi:MAG: UvrD-helicase domain-containing protein [Bacteroidota bacterium]